MEEAKARRGWRAQAGVALAVLAIILWMITAKYGDVLLQMVTPQRQTVVHYVTPSRGPVRDFIISKGTISYPVQISLRAQRSGRVLSLDASEGSSVKHGQTLAELVDPQDELDLKALNIELKRLNARREAINREVGDLRRLFAVGGLSRNEIEQKELELGLLAKDAEWNQVETAKVLARQRQARHISPISGLALTVPITRGQWVNAGDELMTLVGGSGPRIIVQIDAMDLERVRVGQQVVFSAREDGGVRHLGRVQEIGRAVSGGQRQNAVKVTIDPSEPLGELRVSQQLYVEIVILDEPAVLRLPKDYLQRQGSEVLAHVLTERGAEMRRVRVLPGGASYDIVLDGIGLEDRVIPPKAVAGLRP